MPHEGAVVQSLASFSAGFSFMLLEPRRQLFRYFLYILSGTGLLVFASVAVLPSLLLQLSRDCKVEVQRILHQRALDVKLDPELQRRCMTDLGKWCSEKTEAGQELECLQDHLEDLVPDCREVVGNLTELESEVKTSRK